MTLKKAMPPKRAPPIESNTRITRSMVKDQERSLRKRTRSGVSKSSSAAVTGKASGIQKKKTTGKKKAYALKEPKDPLELFAAKCCVSIVDVLQTKTRVTVFQCTTKENTRFQSVIIRKNTMVEHEAKMLLKLSSSRFVVEMFRYHVADSCLFMHQERLIPMWGLHSKSAPHYLPVSCQYFLDGLSALMDLKKANIVHCDIAPGNFMFSLANRCWQLLDFEFAVEIDPDVGYFTYDKVVGTKEYIAPESENERRYMFASDLYSFVNTFYYDVIEVLFYVMETDEMRYRQFATDTCKALTKVMSLGSEDNAQDRESLEVLYERSLDILKNVDDKLWREADFWFTDYV